MGAAQLCSTAASGWLGWWHAGHRGLPHSWRPLFPCLCLFLLSRGRKKNCTRSICFELQRDFFFATRIRTMRGKKNMDRGIRLFEHICSDRSAQKNEQHMVEVKSKQHPAPRPHQGGRTTSWPRTRSRSSHAKRLQHASAHERERRTGERLPARHDVQSKRAFSYPN